MDKINLSWAEYESLVTRLAGYLQHRNSEFDFFVGIARGGLPLMVSLASIFSRRENGVIFMQNTITNEAFSARRTEAICFGAGIPFPIDGKKLLLVDDIIRTGQTIVGAKKILLDMGASDVHAITLYKEPRDYPFDHYSALELTSDTWVVFPWDSITLPKTETNTSRPKF